MSRVKIEQLRHGDVSKECQILLNEKSRQSIQSTVNLSSIPTYDCTTRMVSRAVHKIHGTRPRPEMKQGSLAD